MNNCQLRIIGCLLLLLCLNGCAVVQKTPELPLIQLHRSSTSDWFVRYEFAEMTEQFEFARNPTVGRGHRWKPTDKSVELVREQGKDIVRHIDGRAFDHLEFQLTPTYQHLGKDYAPFSLFSDGGILIHTGRYFGCSITCDDKVTGWQFSLKDDLSQYVLVQSELHTGGAKWFDSTDGTIVYVGQRVPVETRRAWVLIDQAFPTQVVDLLNKNLPKMMDYFAAKFGELPRKPTFFASYDRQHDSSSGSQGGTLPDQIFMHFFGVGLAYRLQKPDFDLWLSWFFAHEVSHLYQTAAGEAESWIHEGAAEAFAAIVLRSWSDRSRDYVNTQRDKALTECREGLRLRPLEAAAEQGEFQLYYWCGLLLHLALDDAVRKNNQGHDGSFAIWKAFESEVANGSKPTSETFRLVISKLGSNRLADWVNQFTTDPAPDLSLPNF